MLKVDGTQDEQAKAFEFMLKKRGAGEALLLFLSVYKNWSEPNGRSFLDLRGKKFNGLNLPGRIFPTSDGEAVEKFLEIWRTMEEHGSETRAVALDSAKVGQYVRAKELLDEAGFDMPLEDYVRESLPLMVQRGTGVTVEELFTDWLEARRKAFEKGRIAEASLKENRNRISGFVHFNGDREVRSFDWKSGEKALEDYYGGHAVSTYNGALKNLRMMLKWGVREEVIEKNWAKDIERKRETDKTYGDQIYTVDEVRRLLGFLKGYEGGTYLGAFVMTLFNGYRIKAARRMKWEDFDLDREDPKVQAKREKNRSSKRIRRVLPNTLEWLKLCPKKKLNPDYGEDHWAKLCGNDSRYSLIRKAGVAFRKNGLRHTFGTYSTVHRGLDETRHLMGHEKMTDQLENHYLEYANKKDAEEFCTLTPGQ